MKLYSELFEEKIRDKAREIYENSGRVEGRELDNWLEAEQIVRTTCRTNEAHSDDIPYEEGMPYDGSDY